jgi:K+-sensing histidine kinase KdpD
MICRVTRPIPRWLGATLASAVLVAAVTAAIALLEPGVPALGLGVLYLLAVVPIALVYGGAVAAAVSLASIAAFSYFFIPPRYSLDPGTTERWGVLGAFLFSSLVVTQLAFACAARGAAIGTTRGRAGRPAAGGDLGRPWSPPARAVCRGRA